MCRAEGSCNGCMIARNFFRGLPCPLLVVVYLTRKTWKCRPVTIIVIAPGFVTVLLGYLAAWRNDDDRGPVRSYYLSCGFDPPSPSGLPFRLRLPRRRMW